ncbi:MAG: class I mannose-6-phosphate isomerase [Bacteroidales bacterium]|nr:class I mannose-6-phosphate isomerase [Bacteroidales bacterium]
MLYPLKFEPQYQYRLWGGNKLRKILGKKDAPEMTGESWEISALEDAVSVVKEGPLAGNNLEELIEVFLGDLVGDQVYEKFGREFPLLIKLIDAQQVLSVQVHPGDDMARERHQAYGKTEMWYVIQADPGATLYTGFNQPVDRESFIIHLNQKTLPQILNKEQVAAGDVFFLPAGRVHATGAGILLAEIQQTSDITYRIYDWDRVDRDGQPRRLHTDLALDAIDFTYHKEYRTNYTEKPDQVNEVVRCTYFTTNFIPLNRPLERDYYKLDSFVVCMCLEGSLKIHYKDHSQVMLTRGETLLLPAVFKHIRLEPVEKSSILEIYIETDKTK